MIRLPMLAPLAAVLFLTALAHDAEAGARRSRPLETGQTTCWDNAGTEIPCAGLQDGALRRGEPRAYRDDGETVRDLRTALTWEKLTDDGSIHDKDNLHTWGFAFAKTEDLNTDPCFAGFCDWRVPNRFELETLLNMEFIGPAVSPPFDTACAASCALPTCSCTGLGAHWTSTSYADDPGSAWVIEFYAGQAATAGKTAEFRVRAVRGGAN